MDNLGYNNTTLKQQNRGLVLKLIAMHETISRVELSKLTGLSKMATTNIVAEFLEKGYVKETEKKVVQGKGRNPVLIGIAPEAPKLVGVYVYRDRASVFLFDLRLRQIDKQCFAINSENADQLLENLVKTIEEVIKRAQAKGERIFGVGIGAIGPIDVQRGMILNPPNFYGLANIHIVEVLEKHFHLPIAFDSQYNGAAIMEKYYGNCRDVEDFIYLGITTGIGSGVVSQGSVLRNASGQTSEIGHVSIDWKGRRCNCGRRGCLEAYASTDTIERDYLERYGQKKTYRDICAQAKQKLDDGARLTDLPMMTQMTDALVCALTNTVNTFTPQKIIIGHEGYYLPDEVLSEVQRRIDEEKVYATEKPITVEKSAFAAEGQIYGCVGSLLALIFSGTML